LSEDWMRPPVTRPRTFDGPLTKLVPLTETSQATLEFIKIIFEHLYDFKGCGGGELFQGCRLWPSVIANRSN